MRDPIELGRRTFRAGVDALGTWGHESQLRMLQEECGELVAIINHVSRGRAPLHAIAPEVADVLILCVQAAVVIGYDRFAEQLEAKVARVEKRVEAAREEFRRD